MKLRASNFKKEIMKRIFFALSVLMIAMLACQMTGLTPLSQPTTAPQSQTSAPVPANPVNPVNVNPQDSTLTVGIVSALGRTEASQHSVDGGGFFSMADIIQTDAAVNPGNSGGPLLNTNGEVVGINRAILTNSSNSAGQPTNSGIAFAVSVNIVKRVMPSLISTGSYDYPYMGISFFPDQLMSLNVIDALGLKTFTGAYVVDVTKGSPADKAGIRAGTKPTSIDSLLAGGELVTAIDGQNVRTFDELISYLITNKSPGDTVVLTVIRDGKSQDITLTLDARPK